MQFLALRKHTPEERLAIVECAIYHTDRLGLVIIDGIRDLVYDINSPVEATTVISKLMQWTDERQLHLHTVLHQNKSDDNARGHIGTELNNKAETVLQISKSLENGNVSEVRAMHIRDKEFMPFAFEIDENALPRLVEDYQVKSSRRDRYSSYTDLSEDQHRAALESAFAGEKSMGYQQLLEALKDGYGQVGYQRGRNTLVNLCKFLLQHSALVKSGRAYNYNPDFSL